MKKFTILESAVIGFLIGVVVSAYTVFVVSMDGFVGKLLAWISLKPVLDWIKVPESWIVFASFVFFIIVFTLYGIVIGLLIRNNKKAAVVATLAILGLMTGTIYEQVNGTADLVNLPSQDYFAAAVINYPPKTPKQYFGNETIGDLNADGKDDVAFIITRDDDERGILYYLSTAISFQGGRQGTNLIYLGEKIQPQTMLISEGIISIGYLDLKEPSSTTTLVMTAQVVDGKLVQNK